MASFKKFIFYFIGEAASWAELDYLGLNGNFEELIGLIGTTWNHFLFNSATWNHTPKKLTFEN